MTPKIAAIQMCSSYQVDENLKTAEHLIQKAALNHAKLIMLPEMFAIIGKKPQDAIAIKENFGDGKIQRCLSSLAKKFRVWIVGGTIPVACKHKNKIRAACIVYDDQGNIAARYDKINLFNATISEKESYRESDTTEPGSHSVVIPTPFGRLGIAICFDIRFTHLFSTLAKKGAEIIAIPAAFTVKTGKAHWKLCARARAIDTFSYIIGACQGGTHMSGRKTYGHSLIVDPWGTVLSETKESGNQIVYAEINLKKLHKIRKAIPVNAVS